MVKEIMVAVRTTGPSPEHNARLRTAIERARTTGLPKENIDRAIERASGTGDDSKLQEFLYEAAAPDGVSVLIEGITDNKNRTLAELKHFLSEHNARLADQGSLLWNFEKLGIIELAASENSSLNAEEIELAIIDSGAKDFSSTDNIWTIETNFAEVDKVRQNLEEHGLTLKTTGHTYRSRSSLTLSTEAHTTIEELCEGLLEHDDVQEVYTNTDQ